MNFDTEIVAAAAALTGAVATKLIEAVIQRFKTKSEERVSERELSLAEREAILDQSAKLRKELWDEIQTLRTSLEDVQKEVLSLREENLLLKAENVRLQNRVNELESRLENEKKVYKQHVLGSLNK